MLERAVYILICLSLAFVAAVSIALVGNALAPKPLARFEPSEYDCAWLGVQYVCIRKDTK